MRNKNTNNPVTHLSQSGHNAEREMEEIPTEHQKIKKRKRQN